MAEKNGWAFADLEQVTAGEYDEFIAVLEDSPRLGKAAPYLTKWVVAWPHEGDPSKVESWKALKLKEWKEGAMKLVAAFRSVMAS